MTNGFQLRTFENEAAGGFEANAIQSITFLSSLDTCKLQVVAQLIT